MKNFKKINLGNALLMISLAFSSLQAMGKPVASHIVPQSTEWKRVAPPPEIHHAIEQKKISDENAFFAKQKADRYKELEGLSEHKAASKIIKPDAEGQRSKDAIVEILDIKKEHLQNVQSGKAKDKEVDAASLEAIYGDKRGLGLANLKSLSKEEFKEQIDYKASQIRNDDAIAQNIKQARELQAQKAKEKELINQKDTSPRILELTPEQAKQLNKQTAKAEAELTVIKEKSGLSTKQKVAAGALGIGALGVGGGLIAGVSAAIAQGGMVPADQLNENAPLSEQGSDMSFETIPVE